MPLSVRKAPARASKRAAAVALEAPSTAKRSRSKGDIASQAIIVDSSQPPLTFRLSPRKALAASQAIEPPTFESELRESQLEEDISLPPTDGSKAATVATTEVADEATEELFGSSFAMNLDGIAWERLPRFCKPGSTPGHGPSWIFRHGYRVALLADPKQIWFICRYCHQHKIIDSGGAGAYDVSLATSAAAKHLGLKKRGHNLTRDGIKQPLQGGGRTIAQVVNAGVEVPQDVANKLGSFDQQRFRLAAVTWLVDNNHPLRELTSPSFREMIELANPAAAAAL